MMITLIIILAVLAVIALLLAASVAARVILAETEKTVAVSYTLFGFRADLAVKTGQVSIAGVPLFRFKLTGKKETKTKKKPTEKKEKKKKRFKFSDLKLEYLKMAKGLIGGLRIRELAISIHGGFMEPFYTGKMYAYYWAARGMYPDLISHINFRPDFSAGSLTIDGKALVSLRMFYIFRFACGLLADKIKEKSNKLFGIKM
ncbi:MAG: hypothetical protein JSU69_11745 [Candidatus Zixiibacteriota bacterium]|nr:MAG: hypothetical protein JSU69_11745 [candidate division Zixibacteria bacterium]